MRGLFSPYGAALALAAIMVFAPLLGTAIAQQTPPRATDEAEAQAVPLAQINRHLKNLPPQSGRFEQSLADGSRLRGRFYMDWPQRLRFAYAQGGTVVTLKDNFIAVQDTPRGEPNWFPVALTPLGVLRAAMADGISPEMIVARQVTADFVALTVRDADDNLPGTATLYFARPSLQLYAWRLVDVQNLQTQVRLSAIETHAQLSDEHFTIEYDEEEE